MGFRTTPLGRGLLRGRLALVLAAAILSMPAEGLADDLRRTGTEGSDPRVVNVPHDFTQLYGQLADALDSFADALDAVPVPAAEPPQWAAQLFPLDTATGPAVLSAATWDEAMLLLDTVASWGMGWVKLDVSYPMLTPAFHDHLAQLDPTYDGTANRYLFRLRDAVDEARARGLLVMVEHSSLGPGDTLDPTSYYLTMRQQGVRTARERYRRERTAEVVRIVDWLRPDRLTVLQEPTTQSDNFRLPAGQDLFTPEEWEEYVLDAIAEVEENVAFHPTVFGAGLGLWEPLQYLDRFSVLAELGYVDLHVRGRAGRSPGDLHRLLDWLERLRASNPRREITIGGTWLTKATAEELASGLPDQEARGRDVYSFWSLLDQRFLSLLDRATAPFNVTLVSPTGTQYAFAYLRYGDRAVLGLSPQERLRLLDRRAATNLASGILSPTGRLLAGLAGR